MWALRPALPAFLRGGAAGQIEFACTVEDQGYAKPLKVAYITGECKWKRIV